MRSKDLEGYGFKEWRPWSTLTVSDVPYGQGVYAIRTKLGHMIMRKVGESDLLYIGQSDNLTRRIFGNYLGGVGGATTQRIHWLLKLGENIEETEISWATTKSDGERKDLEGKLIGRYKSEHGERPPWSYSGALKGEIEKLKEKLTAKSMEERGRS